MKLYIYFLYDSNNILLYIGKTTNLILRLQNHFSKESIKLAPWKETVDKDKVIVYECENICDLDIYETYFINKYQPLHNIEKVFFCSTTFDLPYLEPIEIRKQYEQARDVVEFLKDCKNEMVRDILLNNSDSNYLIKSGSKLKLTRF